MTPLVFIALTAAGGLEKTGDEGTATYAVTLTAEYTRQLC